MNDYRITCIINDTTTQAIITAIDERDARRIFKATHKGAGMDDILATLIKENTPATKAQEREALEKIKAIVETLGPCSYIAAALDGCLQDAEANIDDDAAYSMKSRYEDAQEKLRREIAEHQATKKELEKARRACRDAEDNVDYLGKKLEAAQDRALPADLWNAIYAAFKEGYNSATARMAEAAETMAQLADTPQDIAFQSAVRMYKLHRETQREAERIMGLLEGYAPDGAEL